MKTFICSLMKLHDFVFAFCQNRLSCLLLLSIRLYIAQTFFYSGLSKIADFNTAIYLFEYEYKVPFIDPEIAAYLAASFELICPVFLVAGLFTRMASLPLLATLICFGAGRVSLDYFLNKKFKSGNCV